MAQDATDFIDSRGGPAKIAEAFSGLQPPAIHHNAGAVAVWRHRNKLPRKAWPEILEAYPDVTMAELKAIEARSGGQVA